MSEDFAAPASSSGIQFDKIKGSLLVIEPHALETGIPTSFGEKEAVRADVHVLDGDESGETYYDTLIFPRVLITQTKSAIGKKVLGRLGQGVAKSGQQPPWLLQEATAKDQAAAKTWLAAQAAPAFSGPTSAEPPF